MSNIKLAPDLFVGISELDKLIKSLKDNGYLTLSKAIVNSYGVVINDKLNDSLKLIPGSSGQVTIKAGLAVNESHEYIIIEEDLVDKIVIVDNSQPYYVSISYKESSTEKGTISVSPDGTLTGLGTEFLTLFRGSTSKMPSKIKFLDSSNNISEYTISSVESDELAYINVISGLLVNESDLHFAIVGTYTPGIVIDESNKYPFINDLYEIKVSGTDNTNDTTEFLLGTVSNTGGTVTIVDKRDNSRFSTNDVNTTGDNPIIGTEWVKNNSLNSSGLNNSIQIGWGLISLQGSWSVDSFGQIVIGALKGGVWQDETSLVDEAELVGWRVVFPDGKTSKILSVNLSGGIKLSVGITSSDLTGDLFIVPDVDDIEIYIISTADKRITKRISFDCNMRSGIVEVESDVTIQISYRHLKSGIGNGRLLLLNDGSYYPESDYDNDGNQTSTNLEPTTNGTIDLVRRVDTVFSLLSTVIPVGGIIDYALAENTIPTNWIICDGRLVTKTTSPLFGQTTPNYKGRVSVGFDNGDTDFNAVGGTGGDKEVTLTEAQVAAHTHDATLEMDAHTHDIRFRQGAHFDQVSNSGGSGVGERRTMTDVQDTAGSEQATSTGNITVENNVGDEAHPNVQPYITVYKIMRIL